MMRDVLCRLLATLLAAWTLAGCGGSTTTTATQAAPRQAPPTQELTVAQLAGQRIIASFRGTSKPPAELLARIRRGELAGVVLFADNADTIAQTRRLADRLQRIPRPAGLRQPLLIMVDQEGGGVRRLSDAPPVRSARELGAAGAPTVERAGLATGRALRRAGVNVDLAPVADLARPNGAIAAEGRTFASTTAAAGRLAGAFARGLRAGGVVATVKHFPGMGGATRNTDDAVVRIDLSAPTLRERDIPPFAQTIADGAQMVMLANAIYPAFDRSRPATLSPPIVQGELRDRLGFDGVTVTDDLEADALEPYGDAGRLATRSATAGVDLLLFGRSYAATERAAAALERLPREQLEAGARRVLALRAGLPRP